MLGLSLKSKIQGPIAVIGDVHGHVDRLGVVLNKLRKLPDFEHRWVVFIGDFVDRGPDSKAVLDLFLQLLDEHPKTTAVAGNHEFAMCSSLGWFPAREGANWGERWVKHYNSEKTFTSYGAEPGNLADLNSKIPEQHRVLLTGLPWCIEHPQLLFVHAGLNPNSPYAMQLRILQQRDFTLNRPEWLCEKSFVDMDPPRDCPLTVVSGHVRVDEVQIRPKRILIDTTGGESGDLSCVLMPERRVITSGNDQPSTQGVRSIAARGSDSKNAGTTASGKAAWWNLWG